MTRAPVVTAALLAGLIASCGGTVATTGGVICPDGSTVVAPTGADALPVAVLGVLGDDATVPTACLVGRPLVVNFWAEWCAPCREEMPAFEAVHRALGGQVRFVGIDEQDRPQVALEFAAGIGVSYELLEDPDGAYFAAVRGRGMPTTLLVDEGGTIVYRHAGPLTETQLRTLLEAELAVAG